MKIHRRAPGVKFVAWNLTIRSKTHTAKHTWDEIGTEGNMGKEPLETVNGRGLLEDTGGGGRTRYSPWCSLASVVILPDTLSR